MNNQLVSLIMPVYNAEKNVEKSVDSVLNQTYTNLELIIVNDGSTDNTLSILESYNDHRVYIYTIKNGGPSVARNFGIKKASGNLIQFADADDSLEKDAVEYLVSKIKKSDLVIGSYRVVMDNENKKEVKNTSKGAFSKDYITDNYVSLFKTQVIRHLWNKIYKKEIIDEYNLTFDDEIKRGEGIFFNIEYLKNVTDVYLSPKILYNYYDNEESITSTYVPNFVKDTELIFTEMQSFLSDNSVKSTEINELDALYAHRLMSYVSILYNDTNNLSSKEIMNVIKSITNNNKFQQSIENYKSTSWKMKILKIFFKYKMNHAIYVLYMLNQKTK